MKFIVAKQNPRLMPDIDIASSCSSLLTPAEEYLGYPSYGEHIGSNSFDLCDAGDATLLAHPHGAGTWAERDAHAGALAAAAAAEAEEAEAEEKKNDEKAKARVRDRKRRAKAKAEKAALHRRIAELEAMLGRCAGDGAERWYGAAFFGVSYSFLTRSLSPSHPLSPHSTHSTAHRQQQQQHHHHHHHHQQQQQQQSLLLSSPARRRVLE